jgi:biopolymer transport protein ExbD/biopolymer transport protein TolR
MREPLVPAQEAIAKINVTPMTDVALVLVIILLFTAPMLSVADMPVNLPEAETRGSEDPLFISVTIGLDGRIAIDDRTLEPGEFPAALRARIDPVSDHDVLVVVRADATTPHRMVREAIEEARASGAGRIAVATRQGARAVR